MLDQLVESKQYAGEKRKLRSLFFFTSILMTIVLVTGFVINLFSQELNLGTGDLELSTLVAPVEMPPEQPPVEIPENQPKTASNEKQTKVPQRVQNILRVDETPTEIPDKISTTPSKYKARPNSYFKIGPTDTESTIKGANLGSERKGGSNSTGSILERGTPEVAKVDEEKKEIPPPVLEKPKPQKQVVVSKGVINGEAIKLVTPIYPVAAKNIGVKGDVKIQVTISENGNVISASVLAGHPLLRQSALRAAKTTRFSPTYLSGEKVKVKGIIIYRFKS